MFRVSRSASYIISRFYHYADNSLLFIGTYHIYFIILSFLHFYFMRATKQLLLKSWCFLTMAYTTVLIFLSVLSALLGGRWTMTNTTYICNFVCVFIFQREYLQSATGNWWLSRRTWLLSDGEIRLMGRKHDCPSAHVESGHPHSSFLLNSVALALFCHSISCVTMAATQSAVC